MPPFRRPATALIAVALTCILALAAAVPAGAVTANGRLQIIHLDVGQGDGAVIISPLGQVVMIDDGVNGNPTPANGVKVPAQLQALGVTHVDYHFASHYHSDHIGLFSTIFGTGGVATLDYGWDRGGSYSSSYYTSYASTLGSRRRTMVKNQVITLDSLSAHPVTIKCVDLAGAGISTTDENSLSMQLKITYGEFDMAFGGDTPGQNSGSYKNIETTVGPEMGPIEVYKVHHHGSATSSWTDWLNATQPKVAVISLGNGNSYGHPTAGALSRLHTAGVKTYWTETGAGVAPNATWDKVSNGQVIISATWEPAGVDTIRGNGFADTFTNSGSATDLTPPTVAVTSPDGGEAWKAGSTHSLTWSASDNVGVTGVDLAYSTNGGTSFPNAIATGLANSGSYSWSVPNAPGTTARVRVIARDAAGNAGRDSSAANFTIDTWTITASAGAGGTISPSGSVAVVQGASQGFTIAPSANYHVADVVVDGSSVGAVTSYPFNGVAANHTIAASFAVDTRTITASAGAGGSISPNGAVVVAYGASQHFSIAAAAGYHAAALAVDGGAVAPDTGYTFTNVTANHTIAAGFALNTYVITASAGANGAIAPAGEVTVDHGASQAFHIQPAPGYHVLALTVDGGPASPDTSYTFTGVTAAHTIAVSFSADLFTLSVTEVGGGTVTLSPDLAGYPYGTSVELDAVPGTGWAFAGWSGDTTGAADPLTLTVKASRALTALFVDVAAPVVAVTAPVGGEIWAQGTMRTVTWTATDNAGVDSVDVDYSMSGPGGPWLEVAHGLTNTGSTPWTLPGTASDSVLVRVTAYDAARNAGHATSDSVLRIVDPLAGVDAGGPARLALARPMPNPSQGGALLRFSLPAAGSARLEILDLSGRRLWWTEADLAAGPHAVRWEGRSGDGGEVGAGIYFVRLITPWGSRMERLARLR